MRIINLYQETLGIVSDVARSAKRKSYPQRRRNV